MPPKIDPALIQSLFKEQNLLFKAEIESLRNEVVSLRGELAALKSDISSNNASSAAQQNRSWRDVVTSSVKHALQDDETKNEVVIAQVPENKRDTEEVEALCTKLNITTRPSGVKRLGKSSSNNGPRPLKATFQSQFDARIFLAKVEEANKNASDSEPKIRCRPCRTHQEQAKYASLSKKVRKLNDDARTNRANESFSIRRNGDVWKFVKRESGKWIRDTDWTFSPPAVEAPVPDTELQSGNDQPAPQA